MEILNQRLKQLRLERNMTQEQIAELLKISTTGYASWEQGRSEPNTEMLIKLSKFYKVSTDYLLGQENEDNIIVMTRNLTDEEEELLTDFNSLTSRERNYLKGYIIRLKEERIRKVK